MGRVILGMTMSLDGYINDGRGLRLFEDLDGATLDLEKGKVFDLPTRTSFQFRVRSS